MWSAQLLLSFPLADLSTAHMNGAALPHSSGIERLGGLHSANTGVSKDKGSRSKRRGTAVKSVRLSGKLQLSTARLFLNDDLEGWMEGAIDACRGQERGAGSRVGARC